MPSDLTERLAAKLYGTLLPYNSSVREAIAETADVLLPLLLSEPELVAGLSPEAKREVLRLLRAWEVEEWHKVNPNAGLMP